MGTFGEDGCPWSRHQAVAVGVAKSFAQRGEKNVFGRVFGMGRPQSFMNRMKNHVFTINHWQPSDMSDMWASPSEMETKTDLDILTSVKGHGGWGRWMEFDPNLKDDCVMSNRISDLYFIEASSNCDQLEVCFQQHGPSPEWNLCRGTIPRESSCWVISWMFGQSIRINFSYSLDLKKSIWVNYRNPSG